MSKKLTYEELEQRVKRLEALIKNSQIAIVQLTEDNIITEINPAFNRLFGFEQKDVVGKYIDPLLAPQEYREEAEQLSRQTFAGDTIYKISKRRRKDGILRDVEISAGPLKVNGKVVGSYCQYKDITENKEIEEALRKSEERFRTIFEKAAVGILIVDMKAGKYLKVNPAFQAMSGYQQEELFRMSPQKFTHIDDWTFEEKMLLDFSSRKRDQYQLQKRYRRKDGGYFWGHTTVTLVCDDSENPDYTVTIVEDITERKQAEEELQKLASVVKYSSELINLSTLEGKMIFLNKAGRKMLGIGPEEVERVHIMEVIPDHLRERVQNELLPALMQGNTWQGELQYRNIETGTLTDVHAMTFTIQEPNTRKPLFLANVSIDITERKQAEAALQESEKKYRTILEGIEDSYLEVDLAGNFQFFNDSFCKMLGYSREELTGMNNQDVTDKANAKKVYQIFTEVYNTEKPAIGVDWEIIKKDGTQRYVETSVSLIRDQQGQRIGFRGIGRDVTERMCIAQEKIELEERLGRSEKMESLGLLAGGVAHDLNNVLSGIVSYPDLLLMDIPQDSPIREPILTIKESGKKAATIVQDLLALARRGVTTTEVLDFNEIVSEYMKSPENDKILSYHPGIQIETNLSAELSNIRGSSVHIKKTIMNLVSNAVEAQPQGGKIIVSTRNHYIDSPIEGYDRVHEGEYLILEIKDYGTGIGSDDLKRIFEPFYTKKVMGRSGTGLGMAVVWGTVQDHKGYINVKSNEGEGTVFELYFPLTREAVAQQKSMISIDHFRGNKESVLIVDDVKTQREIATNMLSKLNYAVSSASNGEEAVQYIKSKSPDLIVLDMIMDPGIDGLDTYKKIIEIRPEQKAIIVSGFAETDRVKKTQDLGAGEYIKKPYTIEKIGLAIKQEIKGQNMAA